jgi:hypothetical protein
MIRAKTERVRSPLEIELWAAPLYFTLMVFVVTADGSSEKCLHLK